MADVLFRWLLHAREHERSWIQRALHPDNPTEAEVERIIETAAICVEVKSQHVKTVPSKHVSGSSVAARLAFFDAAQIFPPVAPHFETRTDTYALRESLVVQPCSGCGGKGTVPCSCNGSGRVRCAFCNGKGTTSARESLSCWHCRGSGSDECPECHRSGVVHHDVCHGQGETASWTEEKHVFTIRERTLLTQPAAVDELRLAEAVSRWFDSHAYASSEAPPDFAATPNGVESETAAAWSDALAKRDTLIRQANAEDGECLFTQARFRSVPVSACLLRFDSRPQVETFLLIGHEGDTIEVPPALHSQPSLRGVMPGMRERIRNIAVLPCSGRPTGYLAALAEIGTFVRHIEPADRSYRERMETLLSDVPHDRTQTFAFNDGDKRVRLIEVGHLQDLTPAELERMSLAVDGIIYLEDPEIPCDAIRQRVHASTTARPVEARLTVDLLGGEGGRDGTKDGIVALPFLRRAFLREIVADVDWPLAFDALYAPVRQVLSGMRMAFKPHGRRTSA